MCSVLLLLLLIPSLEFAVLTGQNTDVQSGKIVAVKKIASNVAPRNADAPIPEKRQAVNLTIELGGATYVCRAQTGTDFYLEWVKGKEVQARSKAKRCS
jgi:hypothetical protein